MADEKPTPDPVPHPVQDASLDEMLSSRVTPEPEPAFKSDAFLAGKGSQTVKSETPKVVPPQVIKRGSIGFFTALLMSSVAAGGGAYLALFAGARPDLLQKAGIAAYLPMPPAAASLGTDASNIAPLLTRVSAVEAELLALKTRLDGGSVASAPAAPTSPTLPAPQAGTPASTTPLAPTQPNGAVTDTGALKGELLGISGRVTAIETRLAALDPTGAGGAIVAGLQADIAGLKAIIATLQQQAAAAPSPAVTFAVMNLAEAANRPGPFMIEYETVRAAMPGVPEVAALEALARTGVPTRQLLVERFASLRASEATQAAAIAASEKETGLTAWIRSLFADMIKVQPAPTTAGTGSDAVLTRAKARLDQGDLSGGLDEVATIPAPSPQVKEWLATARQRLELESRISAVRGAVGRTPAAPVAPLAPVVGTAQPAAVAPQLTPLSAPIPPAVPTPKTQGTNP